MADELSPDQYAYFRSRRRQVTDQYNLGSAQNVYQQGALGNQFQRNVGDIAANYGQMREKLPWAHGARGTLNSGIYQKNLYDLAQNNWVRPVANQTGQYQDQLGALQLAGQQAAYQKTAGLSDIEEAERAKIAAVAAALRGAGL